MRVEGSSDVRVVCGSSQIEVAGSIRVASGTVEVAGSGASVTLDSDAAVQGGQVRLGSGGGAQRSTDSSSGSPGQATIHVTPPPGHTGPLTVRIAMPNGEIVERQTDGQSPITLDGQPGERFTVLGVPASGSTLRFKKNDT